MNKDKCWVVETDGDINIEYASYYAQEVFDEGIKDKVYLDRCDDAYIRAYSLGFKPIFW